MKMLCAIAQLNPMLGAIEENMQKLLNARTEAMAQKADIVLAPEMYLTGYQLDDLVLVEGFLERVERAIATLAEATADGGSAIIVGAPRIEAGRIYNSAFVLDGGVVVAVRDKVRMAMGSVFDDARHFTHGGLPEPVALRGCALGLPICEDLWHADVIKHLAQKGAEVVLCLNGSPFETGKADARMQTAVARAVENRLPVIYANLVGGQDDVVFDGGSFGVNIDGHLACYLPDFTESVSLVQLHQRAGGWALSGAVVKPTESLGAMWRCAVLGIRDYVEKNGFQRVVLGLSGGIDSALVATLAVDALGADAVEAVMMPSPFTSQDSLDDAETLAKNLGIGLNTIPIDASMNALDEALDTCSDIAKENLQSRLRGMILMAISNTTGALVLTTGNKSEYAVGYATLYGDMCGGYAPLMDVWKTQVFALAEWRNNHLPKGSLGREGGAKGGLIPERIISKPPSAELRAGQKDSDSLPEYPLLDAIMRGLVEDLSAPKTLIEAGYAAEMVHQCARLLKNSEFKRQQAAPGPKMTPRAFSRDRRFPITSAGIGDAE